MHEEDRQAAGPGYEQLLHPRSGQLLHDPLIIHSKQQNNTPMAVGLTANRNERSFPAMKKIIKLLLEAMTYGYYPELNNVSHMQ